MEQRQLPKKTNDSATTNDQKIEDLKDTALFSLLTTTELEQIAGKIVFKKFKKSEIILHEENTNAFMYIILDGEAKVVQATERGKEILLSMHHAGDFFGELSLIDGKTAPATVVASKDSLTAIISKNDFHELLLKQPKILDNLLKIFCGRIRESIKKIQLLNFNNAAQRLKMLFLLLSETYGEKTDNGTVLKIKLIHQDIADMAGLTRETVTRILDKWQKGGEIEILKNRHIMLHPEFESISF